MARFLRMPPSSDREWDDWNGHAKSVLDNKYMLECSCASFREHQPLIRYRLWDTKSRATYLVVLIRAPFILEFTKWGITCTWVFCETNGRFLYAIAPYKNILLTDQLHLTRFVRWWKRNRAAKKQLRVFVASYLVVSVDQNTVL